MTSTSSALAFLPFLFSLLFFSPPPTHKKKYYLKQEMNTQYIQSLTQNHPYPSPCFVIDEDKLAQNAAILDSIQKRTGAKILLALKGYAAWSTFSILSRAFDGPLYGTCASSPHEAMLGRECFGGEVHAFAAGFSEQDVADIVPLADHMVFNSFAQWRRFKSQIMQSGRDIACGIRINPEHSEGAVAIYDPCSAGSRLGVRLRHFEEALEQAPSILNGISGLHFHTLCEQGADALERTLTVVEKNFGKYLHGMKWLNFGGGHHITREGYDLNLLCRCIERVQEQYGVQVYLEPGEAVALDAGVLLCTVLDITEADMPIVILDTSAAAHMPDVLEMPYRPKCLHISQKTGDDAQSAGDAVQNAGHAHEKIWTCRLAGKSCLAGDIIGEYSFDTPLQIGDQLAFLDMAIYSMVKTTTFNGLQLPAIGLYSPSREDGQKHRVQRTFGYEDFKMRLS